MATNFPTGLDTFPTAEELVDDTLATNPHSTLHGNLGDAIEAIEGMLVGAQYNVKSYGALGDSSTDDTTAFNNAIAAANTAGGGTVFVPPISGYYKVGTITMLSGVRLVGGGLGSQLRHTASDAGTIIYCNGITDFEIANLRLYHSGTTAVASAYAIEVTNSSSRGSIHHNTIENTYIGVVVANTPTGGSSNISVCDNVLHNIGLNAIGINSFGTSSNRVDRNLIYDVGIVASVSVVGGGIEIRGSLLNSCQGNIIRDGNYGSGPYVDGIRIENATEGATARADYSTISNNVISTVSGHGIRVSASRKAMISNNVIYDAGKGGNGNGILLYSDSGHSWSTEDCVVSGNWIEGTNASFQSIRLESDNSSQPTRRNVIIGNRCAGGGEGIECITGTADNLITGNYVYNTTGIGIRHDTGVRNTISNNTVLNCATSGSAPGIGIVGGTSVRVVNNQSYDTNGTPTMTHGLRVYAGPTDTEIVGGKYTPALTGAILDGGTRTVFRLPDGGEIFTFVSADTTPSVGQILGTTQYSLHLFKAASTASVTVTTFDDGYNGQEIKIFSTNGNTSFANGTIKTKTGGTYTLATNSTAVFVYDGTNWWGF